MSNYMVIKIDQMFCC